MNSLCALAVLCCLLLPATVFGGDQIEEQLNSGVRNSDAYAHLLIARARTDGAQAPELLKKAAAAAPDLPLVYFERAKSRGIFSVAGILDRVDDVIQGLDAYGRAFWWSFTLWSSFFFSGVLSFVLAMLVLCLIRLFPDLPLMLHDVRETPGRIVIFLGLVVLSVMSPLLFIAAVLMLLGIYMKPSDRVIVYAYLVFLVISPLVFKTASMFLQASSSGSLKAVVQVNEARDNAYAATVLGNSRDYPGLFSHALARKRSGQYEEAIPLFRSLLEIKRDPRVYVNLGNCYIGLYTLEGGSRNRLEESARLYAESIELKPLATAYYNLSQVYREMLDFPKGEEYFSAAVALDRAVVSHYRAIVGKSPNRMVADEPLHRGEFWNYARSRFTGTSTLGAAMVPPGVVSLLGVLLAAAFYLMNSQLRVKAYRCRKCGVIMCDKCEDHVMWGQMCPQCFASLVKLQETDARERVARILAIHEQKRKRRQTIKALSFFLPGASFIFGGRLLPGILFLWPFLFLVLLPVTTALVVPDSRLVDHAFFGRAGLMAAAVLYIANFLITRKRLAGGWL